MPTKTAGNVFGHILNIKDQTTTTYHHSNQQGPSIQTQQNLKPLKKNLKIGVLWQEIFKPCQITENGVAKLLHHLNPHKSAGPDNITPRVLKELSSEVSSILILILRKSMIPVMCQTYGRPHLFVLSSKKEKSLMP